MNKMFITIDSEFKLLKTLEKFGLVFVQDTGYFIFNAGDEEGEVLKVVFIRIEDVGE